MKACARSLGRKFVTQCEPARSFSIASASALAQSSTEGGDWRAGRASNVQTMAALLPCMWRRAKFTVVGLQKASHYNGARPSRKGMHALPVPHCDDVFTTLSHGSFIALARTRFVRQVCIALFSL